MVRITVVGAGHWGPNLIRNFDDALDSEVAYVVDTDEKRLGQVRSRYPHIATTTDVKHALTASDVDAVVIATPTVTHFELAKLALSSGKHVLVEKPITTTTAQADELVGLAESRGLVLLVGHVFCFNGAVRRVKQYLESGDLGRVYYVSMTRTNLGPIRMDVNAAWDLASHDISIVDYWLAARPVAVSAMGGAWINGGIHDAVFATLRYPNDVLVQLHASWLNPRKCRDITVVGDRRMLTFDDMNMLEPIRVYDKQVTDDRVSPTFVDTFASFRAQVRDGDIVIPKVSTGEPLKNECLHFLDAVHRRATPLTDGAFGRDVVTTLEALDASLARRGAEVTIEEVRARTAAREQL